MYFTVSVIHSIILYLVWGLFAGEYFFVYPLEKRKIFISKYEKKKNLTLPLPLYN